MTTPMHQTLRIPEILLNIFGHCSAPTTSLPENNYYNVDLAVLARTCKTFQEPALDVLWEELHDLSPSARCLPEACRLAEPVDKPPGYSSRGNRSCYLFSRPLKEVERDTLRGYTRRVRFIRGFFGCLHGDTIMEIFSLAPFDDPLFPCLQSLCWDGAATFAPLHVAVPSLTILRLDLKYSRGLPVKEFFDAFGDRCPHIEQLGVDIYSSHPLHPIITHLVCCLPKLQQVVCPNVTLSIDAISHLSSVSNLKRLYFTTDIGIIQDISHLGSILVFSNLIYLDITSKPLDTIASLLRYLRLPAIQTLYVDTSRHISRRDIQAYWAAVREVCPSNVVTNLRLHGFNQGFEDLLPLDKDGLPRLTLEDLRPCTAFAELRELHVNFDCSVGLTDTDLLELASPRMEELLINDDWGWQIDVDGGGITLSGLVQLLQLRPSLHRVCLAIDTRTLTEIPEGLDVSFPSRRRLEIDFVDSYILPEFVPGLVLVLAVLGLDPSMLRAWDSCALGFVDRGRFRFLWQRVLDGLRDASRESSKV